MEEEVSGIVLDWSFPEFGEILEAGSRWPEMRPGDAIALAWIIGGSPGRKLSLAFPAGHAKRLNVTLEYFTKLVEVLSEVGWLKKENGFLTCPYIENSINEISDRNRKNRAGHGRAQPSTPDNDRQPPSTAEHAPSILSIPSNLSSLNSSEGDPGKPGDWRSETVPRNLIRLEQRVYIEDWRYPDLLSWFKRSGFDQPLAAIEFAAAKVNGSYAERRKDSRDCPAKAYSDLIDWGNRAAGDLKKSKLDIEAAEARKKKAQTPYGGNDPPRPKPKVFNPKAVVPVSEQ